MKRLISFIVSFVAMLSTAFSQDETQKLTYFAEFKPATILMKDGKVIKTPLANVFMKDASLLYKRGTDTMAANMKNVKSVKIGEKFFESIGNKLALFIDSVGNNQLYCVVELDIETYKAILKNNVNITSTSFEELMGTDMVSYSTIDLERQEDQQFPVKRQYYYRYNDKVILVHEREILRNIPRNKRHMYESVLSLPEFSWTDVKSLMQMLKAISK